MLNFAPLVVEEGAALPARSLALEMERRYEAYKAQIVKPFFRDHFARLDRQIVLVDALAALNSGPAAVRDMETALTEVLHRLSHRPIQPSELDLPAEDRQNIIRGDQGRSSASHQPRPAGGAFCGF